MSIDNKDVLELLKPAWTVIEEAARKSPLFNGTVASALGEVRAAIQDNHDLDATDGAHPAWWRGEEHGVIAVVAALTKILDEGERRGTFGYAPLEDLAQRIAAITAWNRRSTSHSQEESEELGWKTIADGRGRPQPHASYALLRKQRGVFRATPCYGLHNPWWVPRSLDERKHEEEPMPMIDGDRWMAWENFTALYHAARDDE